MIQGLIASAFRQLAQANGTWPAIATGLGSLLLLALGVFLAWCALFYFVRIVKWIWVHA